MTDMEVKDAAGMVIECGKVTKIKGEIVELSATELFGGSVEVAMKVDLSGGVSIETADAKTPYLPTGSIIELYGPDAKCVGDERWGKIISAEDTVKKWALPGVADIGDIKKAPREITKTMLEAVTRIAMYRSTLDIAFKFETQVWHETPRYRGKSMDRPAFMMAIAYHAFSFCEDDIDDPVVKSIFHLIRIHHTEWSDSELWNEIDKLEKKAIKAK